MPNHTPQPLAGVTALVTTGPTREPIDPVRYISNRSSGKTGLAIARSLVEAGARTIVVCGPTIEPAPAGVELLPVETAAEMREACAAALPVDVAVCVAAVADWRVRQASAEKLTKSAGVTTLELVANPDILHELSRPGPRRPRLVVGFAGETGLVLERAVAKRRRKGCDWIVANDLAAPGVFGGEHNRVALITAAGVESWPLMAKTAIADRLVDRIAGHVTDNHLVRHRRTECSAR
jgi:phosphopantothenoylcysteine decarboxylase/phosphopantothenate--cysteine ligase